MAREAATAALRVRQRYNLDIAESLCPYDLAEEIGLQVRFEAIPSLEGIYCATTPAVIIVSSLRPASRRTFTCAHEIGHHYFGHGTRLDHLVTRQEREAGLGREEYLADRFGSQLLMPKLAVEHAFARRGWNPTTSTSEIIYIVAGSLGVGFRTLVNHMEFTLALLPHGQAASLRRSAPKDIRRKIIGRAVPHGLIVLDQHWRGPVDVEVDDLILMPTDFEVAGSSISVCDKIDRLRLARAMRPGLSRIESARHRWTNAVRVARRGYEGLSKYRHLEDPDAD